MIVSGLINIVSLIYLIVIYASTKHYSIRYKARSRYVNRILIGLTTFVLILLVLTNDILQGRPSFIIGLSIGLFLIYAIGKARLRMTQTLADANFQVGSSILKGKFHFKNMDWRFIAMSLGGTMLWTTLLFMIVRPTVVSNDTITISFFQTGATPFLVYLELLITVPITEEILYRFFFLQIFLHWSRKLTRNRYVLWIAMLIPTIFWAYLHEGYLVEPWIKFLQILPLGIVCTYTAYKKDIEHSIVIHILFNAVVSVLSIVLEPIWFS